jgi:hypothetical protein
MRVSATWAVGGFLVCLPIVGLCADSRATVKIITKLGVETTFEAKYSYSSAPRPVDRLLRQFKADDPGVLLQWTPGTFLILPLGAVRSAEVSAGKARLVTSVGEFTGKLASGLEAADGRRYDLASAVKVEVSHPESRRGDGKDPTIVLEKPAWKLTIPSRPERSFDVQEVEFRFGIYSTEGYIRGGEDYYYDSGIEEFTLRTGGDEIKTQLSDFTEVEFSHAAGKLMVKVKAPNGTTTSGEFVVTRSDSKGDHIGHTRYMVGRMSVANACFVLVGEKETTWKITRIKD